MVMKIKTKHFTNQRPMQPVIHKHTIVMVCPKVAMYQNIVHKSCLNMHFVNEIRTIL